MSNGFSYEHAPDAIYVTHADLDGGQWVAESALRTLAVAGWTKSDPPEVPPKVAVPADPAMREELAASNDLYDPTQHDYKEVLEYLASADPAERSRVIELETRGSNRKSIVRWAPPTADTEG